MEYVLVAVLAVVVVIAVTRKSRRSDVTSASSGPIVVDDPRSPAPEKEDAK